VQFHEKAIQTKAAEEWGWDKPNPENGQVAVFCLEI